MGAFDDLIPNSQANTAGAFDDLIPQAPKQNTGIVGDIGTALKRGVLQMPGMATGLADIAAAPVSIVTGVNRPVSRAADWLGEQTGFQPGKWAEAAGAEYSPEMQQAQQNVEQAKGFFPTLGAVAQNPRVAAQVVAESLPSTIAGGLVARGAMGAVAGAEKLAALRTAAGSADAAVANAARRALLKSGAIAAGVGEGAVTAGQQMAQTGYDVDPALAAGAAIGAGVGTGIIGGLSGRVAGSAIGRKLGLSDIETSMAAGTFGENAGKAGAAGYAKRIGAGAIQEGLLEEAPQSYQEQVWQNLATGKPLTEGAAEAAALGAVAGGVMGGGVNAISGPLTKAVAAAPGAGVPVSDAGIQTQAPVPAAGIASAAQFPQFTAPPQPAIGGAPLEQAPTAMPVPQATQNAPAAPGSPSPVSAADPLPSAKQAEAAGAPIQQPQGPLPSANQTEVAIPPAQGPEAAALPVAAKPAKGIAAALQYPQQVTEGGGPLAQQAADMPLGRFGERPKTADISPDISPDMPAKKATRIASSSGIAGALVTPQQPTFGGAPLEQSPLAMPLGKYGKTPEQALATYKGMTVEQMAKVASQHGHAYEDALQKIKANPGRWVNTVVEWRKAEIAAKLQERKLKRAESFEPNEKQKKIIALVSDSPTYSKDRDLPMSQHNARSTQTLLARGVLSRIEHGDTVEYRVNSKAAPVASRQTPPDAPQQPLSGAGAPQARRQPQPAPIMRRDDLVGAIMRVTGGDGIASNMALTIAGDTAGRGLSKLRGLFTNRGTIDLGEVATRLREDEGFDVRDGEHLSELIRAASFGDTAVSMERAERDQDTAEEKRHRDYIRQNAKKLKIKSVAVKFSDLEQRVIAALTRRHERAVELLDERAKRRFDAALEESYALLPEDVVDAVLVDVSGRGLSPREFWNQATETLRYMVADAKAQKEQEALNAIEGAEPDWLKDDDRRGNQPAGGGEEVNRVAEEAGFRAEETPAAEQDDWLTSLFESGSFAEAKAAETKITNDAKDKNNRIDAAIAFLSGEIEANNAAAAEQAAKKYKQNIKQIYLRGDGPARNESMSIGAINESRKRRAIESYNKASVGAKKAINAIAEDADAFFGKIREMVAAVTKQHKKGFYGKAANLDAQLDMSVGSIVGNGNTSGPSSVGHKLRMAAHSYFSDEAGFNLAAQTPEEIAAAEAAAKEAKQAEAAAAAAEARKEKAAQDKADKDRRAAEVLKEREAAKKAEVDKAAEEFALGQAAPEPVVKKVTTEEAAGQKDIFAAPAPVEPKLAAKEAINDFGEKLEGARKDYAAQMKDAMGVDVASEPLSKSWPEPDYQKLLDGGADPKTVAIVRAARDQVATKPLKAWKIKGWAPDVITLRATANKLLNGEISRPQAEASFNADGFNETARSIIGRADLYELVGHKMSLKGVSFAQHFYSLYKGQQNVRKWVVEQKAKATVFSNWPRELAVGDTKEEALDAFKEKIASLDLGAGAKRQPQFVIYRKRGEPGAWVGKKIGREYIDLHKAADVAEARKYMAESLPALEAKLAKYKETPLERKADNQPRVGDDHRNGAPVTPEVFADTFGFRGVQFGNYVEQSRRQSDLNEAFDGLMDLAAVLGIPPRALSLNGQLGLAFGARGRGGKNAPAAHFETGRVVINLTKGGGPGSLAHEWWHSLDNYFAKQANKNSTEFVTAGARTDGVREAMRVAFNAVNLATSTKAYQARSAELDKRRSKPYWNTSEERSARAFEGYVIAKLFDQGAANDYLANVVSNEVWDITEDARAELFGEGNAPKTYPYPTVDEMPAVRAAFDEFFKTVETKDGEGGNVALFSFAGQQSATADQFQLDRAKQLLADGANANSVRQQTGWFKNPSDGKWRYEIDDSGASLKAHGFGFGELLDALGKNLTLAEVLDHPALFAAYPSIAGSSVETIDEKSQNNGELVTNKDGGFTIRVNAGLGEAKALSVMLHEIQHGIQNVEGFATGGSPRTISAEMTGRSDDLAKAGAVLNSAITAVRSTNGAQAYRDILAAVRADGYRYSHIAFQLGTIDDDLSDVAMLVSEIAKKKGYKELFDAAEAYSAIADNLIKPGQGIDRDKAAYEKYRKLAGEVESRNVQQRQNFPADKRRLSDPLGTQDVAPEDVIVVFNGKDAKDAPAPANTTRASAMAAVGASPADAAVFDMAAEGKSAQEILAFLSKASRRPFNRVLAAALSRIGVASIVSIDPTAGWRNNQGRNGAKFAASYSPKTDTVALYTPREAERHILHEFVHSATLKAIARGGLAARQMQAIFDYVQKTGTMSDQYGMGNFSRFPNETDAQFKKRALDEFTAELFTNPQFQVRLKQLPAPSGSKLKSAWDWIVRVIANLLGLKTRAQETALDRALSVGAALLQENAALTMPKGETARYHTTWHGSPHKFYTFDLSKIGTGEGAQAYGHGLYVAEAPEVAEAYRNAGRSDLRKYEPTEKARNLFKQMYPSGRAQFGRLHGVDATSLATWLNSNSGLADEIRAAAPQELKDAYSESSKAGSFYKVDLPAEAVARMLDWDAALSNQPPEVQSALKDAGIADVDKWTDAGLKGRELYNRAKRGAPAKLPLNQSDDQAFASAKLKQAGIQGIRYLDQQSRSGEKATSNFVLFDDKLARIIEVNGVETGVQPWAPGEWEAAQIGERFSQEQPFSGREVAAAPEDPDIRYSLATNWQQSPVAPGNLYQAAKKKAASLLTPERLDKVIYEMQDKFIDLRRIRDHIKEIGGTITDLNDAYLGEELYHKRLAERSKQFLTDELRPFLADMNARGVEMPEFEKFLHARHAPEANDEMAKRNPNQKQIDAGRQKSAATVRGLELNLQTAKARGLATVAIEKALNDARAELVRWNGAQAFKGTEAERLSLSGMSNADASALMASLTPSQRANMNALAAKVDAINEGTLQTLERYGLMDKAAMNTWRNTYKHYVPLHRDEAHPDSASHPIGQGFNVRGDASKRRTGSNQEVTNIFGHIAMQREAALTRGEKNRVMQKLYLMARQNPIADIWSVGKVPMIDTIDKASGFVRSVPDPQYKDKPNVITLRIAGKDVAIVMNEYNPQALRLAQSIKNLDVDDLHYLIPVVGKATRWFASINTQYNPIFGLINFARDVQTAALNLSTTAIAGKQKEVFKDTMSILGDIIKNKGRMPTAGKWAPIYKELNEVGGTTGYRDLFLTAEDRSKAVTDEIKALDRGKVSQAAHAVAGWLSDYNEAMENATRLAAYKAAIDNGMSKERAASLAKNLTVNFNRKGRQTRELGALYAFFNAAVQGTARMAQTLSGPAGKKIMFGGVLAGAASAMAGIAAMGGGDGEDDEWSKIPEFVKERSLIIPSPFSKEGYFAIPMPLGFHFLPNIGRLMVEMAVYKDKTLGKQMASLFTVLADAFNPLGGSAPPMQIIAPTVMDPFIALAQNKDWTGKPIYVENFNSLNPQPGAARAKDSATPIAKGLADAINAVTGGTKYVPGAWSPTPDQIDYVIGQLTGGVGRELGKLSSTIAAPFTGDELPAHKIPLLGRLYGSTAGATGQAGKFYENIKRANEVENELKGRRKDGISADDYLQDNPKAVELAARGNAAERQIRALRQMRSRIVEAGGDDAASKARQINERMATVMRGFNMQVERMQ